MKIKDMTLAILVATALPFSSTGLAQEAPTVEVAPQDSSAAIDGEQTTRALSFDVGAGIEYDSNVALLELDTSTDAGDTIASLKFGIDYDMPNEGRFDFKAGYDFSETAHEEYDAFDIRLHRGSGTLSWDFGRTDAGVSLQHAEAELDGRDFMTLSQVSPYLTRLAGERLYIRFALMDTEKDFMSNPLRTANADSWSSDFYVFLDGLKTYLLIGLRQDDEDAIDPQFDYLGDKLRVQLTHRFQLENRQLTLRAGLRSEMRDYTDVTPVIGMRRNDERLQFEAAAELPIGNRVTATVDFKRADNRSNLASVDFEEDVLALAFTADF